MELLARKEQIALARQGVDLLKQKRSALLRELMRLAGHALVQYEALQATAVTARQALARAEVMVGETAVRWQLWQHGNSSPWRYKLSM
jgi:vacuolar-type H+-ATPase subunit D/Vma8